MPTGPDWIHEIKYDGYRRRVIRDGEDVNLLSKSSLNGTWRYPQFVAAARKLKTKRFMIDGEICLLDVRGISQFDWLHSGQYNDAAEFYAFGIMALDGDDHRQLPREERKKRLTLLKRRPERIFVAPFGRGEIGPTFSAKAANWISRVLFRSIAHGATGRAHATGSRSRTGNIRQGRGNSRRGFGLVPVTPGQLHPVLPLNSNDEPYVA
ncbi:RNA ligase family protein [Bradyrhizobium sp. LA7.1]|uniref:ATP-dependent DNA ligase n=1 Tax=Bradyrhizobium sp. LA7.1 TaxID=3156324 RepID=UPI003393BF61